MNKIFIFIKNIPLVTKSILIISVIFYFFSLFLYNLFKIKFENYFGLYPFYSSDFSPYQLITCVFTHMNNFTHLFFNLILILIFAPSVEKKLGTKIFFILCLISSLMANFFVNYTYYVNKKIIENEINRTGVKISEIKIKNGHVDYLYLKNLDVKKRCVVEKYNHVISKTYGSSGVLFGVLIVYFFLNLINYKKIIFLLTCLYLIYIQVDSIINYKNLLDGSSFAHIGGIMGGLLIYFYLIINKIKLKKI